MGISRISVIIIILIITKPVHALDVHNMEQNKIISLGEDAYLYASCGFADLPMSITEINEGFVENNFRTYENISVMDRNELQFRQIEELADPFNYGRMKMRDVFLDKEYETGDSRILCDEYIKENDDILDNRINILEELIN